MKKTLKACIIAISAGFLLLPSFIRPRAGAAAEPPLVSSLEITGNETVAEGRIRDLIRTKQGEPFSGDRLSADIRRLMETGLFEEVSPLLETTPEGVEITVEVSERPVISAIVFEGNRFISDRALTREVEIETGSRYDHSAALNDRQKLSDLYRRRGFRGSAVDFERRETEPGRVALVFNIEEGAVNRVRQVGFEGNTFFSDRELARRVSLRPRSLALFRRGTFREDLLAEDERKIAALYREEGFPDIAVEGDVMVEEGRLNVTYRVEEGDRLFFGDQHFHLEPGDPFGEESVLAATGLEPGLPYSRFRLEDAERKVRSFYQDSGYLHARIEAIASHDPEKDRVDTYWSISHGAKITVEAVEIAGNNITRDRVIRREIQLVPGDPFDGGKVRRSVENLYGLRYFRRVDVEPRPGTDPDTTRLLFDVEEEEKTGSLMFGGGYSSLDGFIGQVMLEQKNFDWRSPTSFRGGGQNLRLESSFGGKRRGFSLSFTEPWVGDRPVSFGFDAYDRRRFWSEFDEHRSGGALRFGWRPEGPWRYSLSPGFERARISNVSPGATDAYRDEEGKTSLHSLSFGVTRDGRDSRLRPRSGTLQSLSLRNTGGLLGGDRDFWKTDYRLTWYRALPAQFTLSAQTNIGYAGAYGDTESVPVFERYFVGGTRSVRGYPDRSLGPRDENSGDPVGGNFMVVENIEAIRPLTEVLGLAFFVDAGYSWDSFSDFSVSDMKVGLGAGLRITVPFLNLPIKLDYAYALDPEPGESRSRIHFDIDLFSF